jgi:hypothetical protein
VSGGWTRVGVGLTSGVLSGQFGYTLALNADASTLVVGALYEAAGAGAVYIYIAAPGSGVWSLQRKILPSDASASMARALGSPLALSSAGDTVAVGGAMDMLTITFIVVFVRDGSGVWSQSGLLNTTMASLFHSLSMNAAGDALAAGAALDNTDASMAGSVYAALRSSGGVWGPLFLLRPSDSAASFRLLGFSASMSAQGSLVVSAPMEAPVGAWWSVRHDDTDSGLHKGECACVCVCFQ